MPLEPLHTDEKLDSNAPRSGMDEAMLAGCGAFLVGSLATFFLTAWPFLVLEPLGATSTMGMATALSSLIGGLGTFFATVRADLPAGVGALGGALASAFCAHLRLDATFRDAEAQFIRQPEFSATMRWIAPLCILAVSIAALLVALQKRRGISRSESKG